MADRTPQAFPPGRPILPLALSLALLAGCSAPRPAPSPPYEKLVRSAEDLQREGGWAQADPLLVQAVQARPERPEAYALRGDAALHAGDFPRAAAEYQASLQKKREQPAVLNGLAIAELGRGNPDLAYAAVRQALAYSPSPEWPFLDTLARAHAAAGRREEALAAAREALALAPAGAAERRALEDLILSLGRSPGPSR